MFNQKFASSPILKFPLSRKFPLLSRLLSSDALSVSFHYRRSPAALHMRQPLSSSGRRLCQFNTNNGTGAPRAGKKPIFSALNSGPRISLLWPCNSLTRHFTGANPTTEGNCLLNDKKESDSCKILNYFGNSDVPKMYSVFPCPSAATILQRGGSRRENVAKKK